MQKNNQTRRDTILQTMTKQIGLISDVLGKELSKLITRNERKEALKTKLSTVYGYHNVYTVFPEELDDKMTMDLVRILFQSEQQANSNEVILQK